MMKRTSLLLQLSVAALLASFVLGLQYQSSYAQSSGSSTTAPPVGQTVPDIHIEPSWDSGGSAKFKVSFVEPGTDTPQLHEDYDVVIMKGDQEVFSAAKSTGQTVLHTIPGVVTIPYNFKENGDYTVKVTLYALGIQSIPITPKSVSFPIKVTPEFPTGMAVIAAAGMVSVAVVLARGVKVGKLV